MTSYPYKCVLTRVLSEHSTERAALAAAQAAQGKLKKGEMIVTIKEEEKQSERAPKRAGSKKRATQ